ncbi:hypothetical protein [Planctomicrobium sp. SH664]|uniref:hypothetical protein n=1 Tax=Planctomicrobium sp. SH664 TaxID=3448125 RepID=UPI003F5B17EC
MYLTFICPHCDQSQRSPELRAGDVLLCGDCEWKRPLSDEALQSTVPSECLRCGNPDLWRQKNFPQWLGLTFVAVGAVTSSIAWGYHRPILALAILMGFALLDMILYMVMPDVLVCYRCRTKHHQTEMGEHAGFNHELAERYRQEQIRLRQSLPERTEPVLADPPPPSSR